MVTSSILLHNLANNPLPQPMRNHLLVLVAVDSLGFFNILAQQSFMANEDCTAWQYNGGDGTETWLFYNFERKSEAKAVFWNMVEVELSVPA